MSIKIEYLGKSGILMTGEGEVTGQELIDANEKLYASDEQTAAYEFQLADFTKVTQFSVSQLQIKTLVRQDRDASKINSHLKMAIVGDDALVFGFSRMWQTYLPDESLETEVFRTMDLALEWLQISDLSQFKSPS